MPNTVTLNRRAGPCEPRVDPGLDLIEKSLQESRWPTIKQTLGLNDETQIPAALKVEGEHIQDVR